MAGAAVPAFDVGKHGVAPGASLGGRENLSGWTTGTTALDPVAAMADLAKKHGMWLHVDAALAGTAMVLPECRWMWEGVERADSLVFNPHKWMGVGFDLSAYYVRDPQHLIRVMSTNPSYLRTAQDGQVSNFRDWHIQLGRRFRALKLWFYLMDVGVEGLQARLRRDLDTAQWLKDQVDAAPDWERLGPCRCRPCASVISGRASTTPPSPPTTWISHAASTRVAAPTSHHPCSRASRCSA